MTPRPIFRMLRTRIEHFAFALAQGWDRLDDDELDALAGDLETVATEIRYRIYLRLQS